MDRFHWCSVSIGRSARVLGRKSGWYLGPRRSIRGCEISEVFSDSLVCVPDFGSLDFVFQGGVHL